jgi:hypothetical protein
MEEKKMAELNEAELSSVAGGDVKERRWIKYQVVDGDTLWSIKKRYNCTVTDIKKWNNLKSETIGPWMVLDLYTDNY